MPAEKTSRATSSSSPVAKRIDWMAPSGPAVICVVEVAVCTTTPSSSMRLRSTEPPVSSSCRAMSRGANSMTCTFIPSFIRA